MGPRLRASPASPGSKLAARWKESLDRTQRGTNQASGFEIICIRPAPSGGTASGATSLLTCSRGISVLGQKLSSLPGAPSQKDPKRYQSRLKIATLLPLRHGADSFILLFFYF